MIDRETLRNLPREQQDEIIRRYLNGGRLLKKLADEPVYFRNDDDTLTEFHTGRIVKNDDSDPDSVIFE